MLSLSSCPGADLSIYLSIYLCLSLSLSIYLYPPMRLATHLSKSRSVYTRAWSSLKILRRPASAAASFWRWHINSSSSAAHRACAACACQGYVCVYLSVYLSIYVCIVYINSSSSAAHRACAAARHACMYVRMQACARQAYVCVCV